MKKVKIFLGIGVIIIFLIFSVVYYMYNKPAAEVKNEEAFMVISANELVEKFNTDPNTMTSKLLDKIIEVTGKVSIIEDNNGSQIIILGNGVKCEVADLNISLKKDQLVTIKGIYSGFDDMFNELSLTRCVIQ